MKNSYQQCLAEAMNRADQLLREDDAAHNFGKIQSVKSILYAAIERAETESERLISTQELLRELLTLVVLRGDPVRHERQEALKILEQLKRVRAQENAADPRAYSRDDPPRVRIPEASSRF